MSEYYRIAPSGPTAIAEMSERDEDYINFLKRARAPAQPLRIYETFRPKEEYELPEHLRFPTIGLAKRVVFEAGLQYTYGINWVPANLTNNKGSCDYLYMNFLQEVKCVDLALSEYHSFNERSGTITGLRTLIIDEDELAKTPLNQRLIFEMKENAGVLFHRSVVERIMATNPISTTFVPCKQFG